MSTAIQRRRGTTSQHATFTGLAGETTVDTDKNTVVVHNGSTAGGFPLLRENFSNAPDGVVTTSKLANDSVATAKLADGVLSADVAGRAKMADGFVTVPKIETSVTARFGLLRNLLLNPSGGAVFQRTVAVTADDVYFADRWYALTELGNVTPSVLTDPEPGYPFGTRLTQSNTTAQRFGFAQIIEGRNCKHLRGWSGVLGARLRASGSQTIRYAVLGWTGTEDTVTSDIVNNWSSTSFTAGGFFISSNLSVLAVGSQAVTANTWTSLTDISASMGTSFNNVIIMVWTESAQAQNFTLDWDWVQFERGSVLTPPDWRGTAELALCQRYGRPVFSGSSGRAGSATVLDLSVVLSSDMRVAPTLVFGGFSGANTTVAQLGVGNVTVTGISASINTTRSVYASFNTTGATTGSILAVTAGDLAFASAEL